MDIFMYLLLKFDFSFLSIKYMFSSVTCKVFIELF